MSVIISKYPKRTTTGGHTSKWVALHNPIIYEVQRKDYIISNITEYNPLLIDSVFALPVKITIPSAVNSPDTISVGDSIYIKSGNNYDAIGEVTIIISATQFILNIPFNGNSSGGFMNLNTIRENYHLQVEILGANATNYYILGTASITPTPKGLMKIDVHEWVKELAGYENNYDYVTLNIKDENLSGIFNIRFIEIWRANNNNNIQQYAITIAAKHFFVNAAKQIADTYGQNMGRYVPFPSADADKAKWLSGFERPTVFRGYPFDLQFIYSDNINSYIVFNEWNQFDLNGQQVSGNVETLDVAGIDSVNRLKLPSLQSDAKTIDMVLYITLNGDADTTRYSSAYATEYADDYYETITTPEGPDPPVELEIS